MAIFGRSDKEAVQNISVAGTTTIAQGTRIEGDMNLECNLNIDGYLRGNIDSTGGVTIGRSGRIEGTLTAERVVVSGIFKGDVECSIVEILSGGRVEGNVLTANLVIEDGGIFEGVSKRRDSGVLELKEEKLKAEKEA